MDKVMDKTVDARGFFRIIRWALVAGALGFAACAPASDAPAADPGASVPRDVGSVSFELTIAGGFQFSQVSYDISGNGFHKAADVSVAGSSTVSTVVSGIPIGVGYTVKLAAQDTADRLTPCTGAATFDVAGGAVVPVPVHLTCRVEPQVVTSVPIPRSATAAFGLVLLALGAAGVRRRPRKLI
jgi:hypothetical protein